MLDAGNDLAPDHGLYEDTGKTGPSHLKWLWMAFSITLIYNFFLKFSTSPSSPSSPSSPNFLKASLDYLYLY